MFTGTSNVTVDSLAFAGVWPINVNKPIIINSFPVIFNFIVSLLFSL